MTEETLVTSMSLRSGKVDSMRCFSIFDLGEVNLLWGMWEFVVSWLLFYILLPQHCCQQIAECEIGPAVESGFPHGGSNDCPKVDRDIRH